MEVKDRKRIAGLDIIRVIAILFVISVHFFRSTGFYTTIKISGEVSFIMISLRWLFYTCVPLFLLLTGYLNKNKIISKKYYKGLLKVVSSYFFISIVCIFARIYFFDEHYRKLKWLMSIFDFTADGYAWYIEMYIGLFLIIPFLNVLYCGLKDKKHKQYLILTLLFMTSIAPMINGFDLLGVRVNIIPDFWLQLYPLTYYFIGVYIADYQLKIPKMRNIIEICVVLFCQVILYFVLFYNKSFSWSLFDGYNSFFTLLLAVLIFLLFYDVDIKCKNFKRIVASISLVSLDMYLLSYLIDLKVYPYVLEYIKRPIDYLKYMVPIVVFIFIICYLLALLKKVLFDFLFYRHKKAEF